MVQVTVSEGVLEGQKVDHEFEGHFYSFKGIPYAQPPLGDLRFKEPQPPKSWSGVRSAKEFGPICYQVASTVRGSEDCLYLNVYTPQISPSKPLPVMFWIHGGSMRTGSGDDHIYAPDFLVRHDVILVTFNYRLEVLGFLCLDSEDVPGNAGLKDQVAALKWVNRNISNFGGDPNNVTVFGVSSGAACVTYHMVSPMSKGLFRRAIVQSGAATCPWSIISAPRDRALLLAKKLGCHSEDNQVLYEFFKSLPVEALGRAKVPVRISEEIKDGLHIYFSVVNEKDFGSNERFFYGDIFNMPLTCSKNVEVIVGYTDDEGFMNLAASRDHIEKLLDQVNNFVDFMVPLPIATNCSVEQQLKVAKRFKKYYLRNEKLSKENLDLLANYHSFEIFIYGIMQWINLCLKTNTVYVYKFTCKSERNFLVKKLRLNDFTGDRLLTCHADDVAYLFPAKALCKELDKESNACKMIDNITMLWTNFAKYGNPTPTNDLKVAWKPYSIDREDYLIIGNELIADKAPDKEEMKLWEVTFREFLPQQTIR